MFSGTELGTHLCQVDVRLGFPARGGCGCERDLGEWGEANMTQFVPGQLTTSDTRSPAQTAQTLPSHSLLPGGGPPGGLPGGGGCGVLLPPAGRGWASCSCEAAAPRDRPGSSRRRRPQQGTAPGVTGADWPKVSRVYSPCGVLRQTPPTHTLPCQMAWQF